MTLAARDPSSSLDFSELDAETEICVVQQVSGTTYTPTGLVATSTNANGGVTTYGYDALGEQVSEADPAPNPAAPAVQPVTTDVYDPDGELTAETDPMGHTTAYTYADDGREVTTWQGQTSAPDPTSTAAAQTWTFNNLTPNTDAAYEVFVQAPASSLYGYTVSDGDGDLWPEDYSSLSASALGSGWTLLGTVYLPSGSTTITVSNSGSPSTANVCLMQWVDVDTYNADGNLTQEEDALGNTTTYTYNNLGQPAKPASPTNGLPLGPVYDKAGNVASNTDLLGNVTSYSYNSSDQVTQVFSPFPDTQQSPLQVPAPVPGDTGQLSPSSAWTTQSGGLLGSYSTTTSTSATATYSISYLVPGEQYELLAVWPVNYNQLNTPSAIYTVSGVPQAVSATVSQENWPGRLHHKSRSDKDLCEIGFVPGSGEAFVLDPDFVRRFVLQHCQCRAAEDAEVGVGMSFADATQVFLEGYVELPVQPVLDPPMAANRACKATRGEVLAEDVVADVSAFLAIALGDADDHPDGLQARPTRRIGQVGWEPTEIIRACLLPTVPLPLGLIGTVGRSGEVVLQAVDEVVLDGLVQRRLVFLHMEDVIALAVEDLLGDLRLAAHRVDGHQGPGNVDDFQQFRDRCDLVALGVGDDLTKANGVRCGPGTDHVNRRLAAGGVVTAAERLAVDGDHLPAANLVQRGDPTEQTLLELRRIDGGEDRVETIVGRDALLQIQKSRKPLASRLAELRNGHEVVGPADDRTDGDCHDVDQGIDGWPSSGIGESCEVVLNLGGLLGHDWWTPGPARLPRSCRSSASNGNRNPLVIADYLDSRNRPGELAE